MNDIVYFDVDICLIFNGSVVIGNGGCLKSIYVGDGSRNFYESFFVLRKYMLFFVLVSFVVEEVDYFFFVEFFLFFSFDEEFFFLGDVIIFLFWSLSVGEFLKFCLVGEMGVDCLRYSSDGDVFLL